jgi:hypothetical protein
MRTSAVNRNARGILLAAAALSLFGCATDAPLTTPSKRPEVTIQDASRKEVVEALTGMMIDNGYLVKSIGDYTAEYARRMPGAGSARLFAGSSYDSTPEAKAHFDIVDSQQSVRVVASLMLVRKPGGASESVTDLSRGGADARDCQRLLEKLRWTVESKYRGQIGIQFAPDGVVQAVKAGDPATAAGVQVGDRIVEVDGKPLPRDAVEAAFMITGKPGTRVLLTIVRNGKEQHFAVERQRPPDKAGNR